VIAISGNRAEITRVSQRPWRSRHGAKVMSS
jgi:hypothetical protein